MGEVYLEIVPLETGLRVTAVDAETGAEVVFAAPANCSRDRINELALAKIARRLRLDSEQHASTDREGDDPSSQKRGRLV
ncbi:MAG: serine hydroxymethyltransferase [Pseudomonadota bacterium]